MQGTMKITGVEAIPFSIPLGRELSYKADSARRKQQHVLVRVVADNGMEGISEATPRPAIHGETQVSVKHIIDTVLGPALLGRDPFDREGYWQALDRTAWNPTAKGALCTAIHDLLAKACGLPLARFLGGGPRPVRVSYMIGFGSPGQVVAEAEDIHAATGINAFKLKCGLDPVLDIERVRRLRQAFGANAFIFVDANEGYAPHTAVNTLQRMAEHGVAMAEEPVSLAATSARREVARQIPMPLLADDSVATLPEAARQLAEGTIGVLGIKPPRSGLHRSAKLVALAQAHGLPCWIGSQGVTGVGTLSSAHFAAAFADATPYPADLGNFLRQQDDLLAEPACIRGGFIEPAATPGSGVAIDTDKLTRYRVD